MVEYSEINIFDYFRVIKKRRWLIFSVTIISVLISSIITSTMPEQYVSTVTLILPQGRRVATGAGLAYLSQVLAISTYNPSEFERPYNELLQSRNLAKKVAKILGKNSTAGISVYRTGGRNVFSISCKHSDRRMAALMANAYAQALYDYEQETAQQNLDERIKFINEQLERQEKNLKEAEQNLIDFQRTNKTISLDAEVNVAVQSIAKLKYEIIAEEAELNNALKYYSENHPDMIQMKNEIAAKKAKLEEEVEKAISPEAGDETGSKTVMSNLLEKSAQFYKLLKMVEIQRAISRIMLEESEKLKLEKGKIYKPFEIIDPAVPARFPTLPNVKLNILLGFILGLVTGISLSFFLEYLENLKKKETGLI